MTLKGRDRDNTPAVRPRGAALSERRPYWARCGGMDVDELARFIEDALEKLSEPESDAELPRSEEDFRSLWMMLREKARALTVPYVPSSYRPSEKVGDLREKRERTLAFLASAPKKSIKGTENRLRELDQEIARLRAKEEREHPKLRSAYLRSEPSNERISGIVGKVRKDIDRAFEPGPAGRLQWQLARPGSLSVSTIRGHYEEVRRSNPAVRFDMDRFEKAFSLPWENHYTGTEGFDGYVIFTFAHTKKALMECAKVGNAVYVIHSGWEDWSRKTKQDLMEEAERGGEVTRIPHQGQDWFERVKRELEIDDSGEGSNTQKGVGARSVRQTRRERPGSSLPG